ncbi:hypothetical protein [Verminephrobacter eiseniae]|uniref:hypothetical protein n=1 Tax=Verminephrobacter eiseniae TaxID=364317 RepID=UPI0022379365|nr:hypothetical protein [Verminephrobacter eiseniae]
MRDIPDRSAAGTAWGTAFSLVFSLTPGVVAVAADAGAGVSLWGRYAKPLGIVPCIREIDELDKKL